MAWLKMAIVDAEPDRASRSSVTDLLECDVRQVAPGLQRRPNRIFKTGRWSLAALIAASLVFALPAPATTIDMVATVNFDAVQTLGGSTCPGPGTYTFTASWDDTAPYDETITFTGSDPGPRLTCGILPPPAETT